MSDYLVIPFQNNEEMRNWLERDYGVVVKPGLPDGRLPTPAEIRSVVKPQNGFEVEHRLGEGRWQIDYYKNKYKQGGFIRYDEWATFYIYGFNGELKEDEPVPNISIDNASPELVLEIGRQLSRQCGPLLVLLHADYPVLVTPDYTSPINREWWGL